MKFQKKIQNPPISLHPNVDCSSNAMLRCIQQRLMQPTEQYLFGNRQDVLRFD